MLLAKKEAKKLVVGEKVSIKRLKISGKMKSAFKRFGMLLVGGT